MRRRADARRCKFEFPGTGLHELDELAYVRGRQRVCHAQNVGHRGIERDWSEIAQVVIGQLLVERGGDRLIDAVRHYGVAIGYGTCAKLGADDAGGPRTVVDDQRLSPRFAEALREDATYDVGGCACTKRQYESPRFGWIVIRRVCRAHTQQKCRYCSAAISRLTGNSHCASPPAGL